MMIALWILAAGEAVWASQGIAAAAERDVPADSTKPLVCETPDEVETGQPFVVRCAAAPRDKVPLVVLLHFRRAGQEGFMPGPEGAGAYRGDGGPCRPRPPRDRPPAPGGLTAVTVSCPPTSSTSAREVPDDSVSG
jgi:hypothetical protein